MEDEIRRKFAGVCVREGLSIVAVRIGHGKISLEMKPKKKTA